MDFRMDLDWPQSGYEIITEWRGRRYCLQSREFWTPEQRLRPGHPSLPETITKVLFMVRLSDRQWFTRLVVAGIIYTQFILFPSSPSFPTP